MALSSLQQIREKVRKLTRSPSTSQLTDFELDQYINTWIQFDMPSELRLFSLRSVLTFYTQPFIDTYETNTTDPLSPLFDFQNKYIAVHPPVFMLGVQAFFTQYRDVFYANWPQTNTIAKTGLVGNGTIGVFTGIITAHPMLQNNVIFTVPNSFSGENMVVVDFPINNTVGNLAVPNEPDPVTNSLGSINYVTGAYSVSFPGATLTAAPIWIENIAYQPSRPIAMLYYDNKFTIRPVPDNSYAISIEVDVMPTELLAQNEMPKIHQWWQLIAYGASIKLFQDRFDNESANAIMPEYDRQLRFALRTTITQLANQRTTTIFTTGAPWNYGGGFNGGWPY